MISQFLRPSTTDENWQTIFPTFLFIHTKNIIGVKTNTRVDVKNDLRIKIDWNNIGFVFMSYRIYTALLHISYTQSCN